MRIRVGPGPVFVYEWLTTTRRWQVYALRAGFVAAILVGMAFVWHSFTRNRLDHESLSIQELARFGDAIFRTVALTELTLVLLAAPAATAGAVCLDKARGTLDHLLTTDLSAAEIVLGKLGVRLIPVLGLIACVLPVIALSGLLGGIDPTSVLGSFLTSIACAVLGCSLALAISVWGRKTHEVLALTYAILILWLIAPIVVVIVVELVGPPIRGPAPPYFIEWLLLSNPYYLALPSLGTLRPIDATTFLGFLVACLVVSGLLVALATARIRNVVRRQAGRPAASFKLPSWFRPGLRARAAAHFPTFLWLLTDKAGPSLDGNPVFWREWHRARPTRMLRVAWLLYATLGIFWVYCAVDALRKAPVGNRESLGMMAAFQVTVGLLLASIGAATSLAEERVRGSLDILLSTPLSTTEILAGKWWGAFRHARPALFWMALLGALQLGMDGSCVGYVVSLLLVAAYGAVIASLGLALATWVSRLGRAVALCVSAYVVFSIGWILLAALVFWHDDMGLYVCMASPPAGAFWATCAVSPVRFPVRLQNADIRFAASVWTLISVGVAALLFAATRSTFDRCLGRMPEKAPARWPTEEEVEEGKGSLILELDGQVP